MKQLDSNYLSMVHTLLAGLDSENGVWNGIRPMQEVVNQLRTAYAKASEEAQIRTGANPIGYTAEKDSRFVQLIEKSLRLSKALTAYAKINKENALLPLVEYSYSSLSKGNKSQVVLRCQTLVGEANKRLQALQDYQVSAEEMAELQRTIEVYQSLSGERNLVKGKRSLAIQNLSVYVQTLKQLVDTLDDLVPGTVNNENFQHSYRQWRKISSPSRAKSTAPVLAATSER